MVGLSQKWSTASSVNEECLQKHLGLAMDPEETIQELDVFYGLVKRQLLMHQSPNTHLFPVTSSSSCSSGVASIRDSVYCASAIWALGQAYNRLDDDRGKSYELSHSVVACMRGVLQAWMRQSRKLEQWKAGQCPSMALHSMVNLHTGEEILSTDQYHHLQLDCVSLYLLYLVQMITSGLEIIYSMEEVALVQNLVYYIERTYRTPDFGTWGRGTKYNDGNPEVHASSIGMAKAALEAVNGFNLFGERGSSQSVIYADIDAHNRNRSIFETLLPRESNTKNTDISLLATISYPAFATHNSALYERTKARMVKHLAGQYGFKRFLRDGFGTDLEEIGRRYYQKGETLDFQGVENEWPIFFIFMIIDGIFKSLPDQVEKYQGLLEGVITVDPSTGDQLVPRMYSVPGSLVREEKEAPRSVGRKITLAQPDFRPDSGTGTGSSPALGAGAGTGSRSSQALGAIAESEEGVGDDVVMSSSSPASEVFLWGQAMHIISQLLTKGLLHLWELDPIRRYLPCAARQTPPGRYSSFLGGSVASDLVVQVVIVAESTRLQCMLSNYGIQTQTPTEVEPVQLWPPGEMVKLLGEMGACPTLGLGGRPPRPIGSLGTSKLYRVAGKTVLCYPIIFSASDFYLSHDMALLTEDIRTELRFISKCWRLMGRPTFCILLSENDMRDPQFGEMVKFLAELRHGHCEGVKVRLGRLQNLVSSACVEHLGIEEQGGRVEVQTVQELRHMYAGYQSLTDIPRSLQVQEELVDLVSQYKDKESWEVVEAMGQTQNMYGSIQLCGLLLHREGPDYSLGEQSVRERLECMHKEAGRARYWAALRYSTSLLKQLVDSICPCATQILVNGKTVTVGTVEGERTEFIKPFSPQEIHNALYTKVAPQDVTGAVVQQELILCCGKLIETRPQLFRGTLVLRMPWLARALELYQGFIRAGGRPVLDQAPSSLLSLSPHTLRQLLISMLEETSGEGKGRLQDSQINILNGCLSRVPEQFYPSVFLVLQRCQGGLTFQTKHLPQLPTVKLVDPTELSFAHMVDGFFTQYREPKYRWLMIRLLTVLATVLRRNPEMKFQTELVVESLICGAHNLYLKDQGMQAIQRSTMEEEDLAQFLSQSQGVLDRFLARAVVNLLLGDEGQESQADCSLQ